MEDTAPDVGVPLQVRVLPPRPGESSCNWRRPILAGMVYGSNCCPKAAGLTESIGPLKAQIREDGDPGPSAKVSRQRGMGTVGWRDGATNPYRQVTTSSAR
jgi:hypothetical protein